MPEPLDRLRRTYQATGAAPVNLLLARLLIHFTHGVAATGRTFVRKRIGLRPVVVPAEGEVAVDFKLGIGELPKY